MTESEKIHWSWQPGPYYLLAMVSFFAGATLYRRTHSEFFILGGAALFAFLASYAMHLSGERAGKIVAGLGVIFAGMSIVHEFLAGPSWPTSANPATGALVPIVVDGITRYAATWEHLWLQSAFWVGMPCMAFIAIITLREWLEAE